MMNDYNSLFLKIICCCKFCEHYIAPDYINFNQGFCNIHECATTDENGMPRDWSSYPEVSEAWEKFGENEAAKYCGAFEAIYSNSQGDE